MTIELVDKPGQLQHVSEIIASTGANVVSVYHERVSHTADINGCYLRLEMETRNQQQINDKIRQLLTVSGYKIVEGVNNSPQSIQLIDKPLLCHYFP